MKLHESKGSEGSRTKRKRVGRGMATGHGKTSGKSNNRGMATVHSKTSGEGHKGQNARAGKGTRRGFEGRQPPLFQRLPKRGFTNINRKEYAVVNIETLNRFEDNTEVTPELLVES